MSSLADKMKRAAALMRGAGEEKKVINTALGVSSSASIAETKAAAVEHKNVIAETKAALGVPASEPIAELIPCAVEHKDFVNEVKSSSGLPADASLSQVKQQVQNDYNSYNKLKTSASFYKCTAVDTENMMWSGQKAVLSGESYSFEDTVTEGLTFGDAFTPSVGKIYSEDLRVVVRSLFTAVDTGAILYAPFIDSLETETGQTLTLSNGTVTYTEVDGVPCICHSADEPTITGPLEIPEKFTICFWAKTNGYYGIRVDIGGSKRGTMTLQVKSDQIIMTEQYVTNFSSVSSTNNTALSCFVGTFDSVSQQIWKDGVLLQSTSYVPSSSPPEDSVRIRLFDGSMTRLRIFDRILTANEIIALADELQPNA